MPRLAVGDLTIDLEVPARFRCEYALNGSLAGLDASSGAGFEISGLQLGARSGVDAARESAKKDGKALVRDSASFVSFMKNERTWIAGFSTHLLIATLKKPELIGEFGDVLASVAPAHDPFPADKETAFSALRPSHTRWFEQRRTSLLDANRWSAESGDAPAKLDLFWQELLVDTPDDQDLLNAMLSGVAVGFGDLLVKRAGFEWCVAKDPWGISIGVVALKGTANLLVVPDSFVAKRWETKEPKFIADAIAAIGDQVKKVKAEWDAKKS
ncbi:MAG: hypothetical protein QM817_06690 [Archangium sp.]